MKKFALLIFVSIGLLSFATTTYAGNCTYSPQKAKDALCLALYLY